MKQQYIKNREKVIQLMNDDSVMILFSGHTVKSSADGEYPFVVNRNFYHLTGINEPHLMLVLDKDRTILFIEESNEMYEKWIGKKISKELSEEKSGITDIRYLDDFSEEHYTGYKDIYLDLEEDEISYFPTLAEKFMTEYNLSAVNAYDIVAKSRSTKGPQEVEKIVEALKITDRGLNRIMKNMKSGLKESVFEAHFNFELKCENVINSFDTIAASGVNATTLHYVTNDEIVEDGELVLFDLGATKDLYCGDISRTYPVNGKFTDRQKDLYNMVLKANELVIDAIKPGVTMTELNDLVVRFYETELMRLGVIENKYEVKDYYYHGVSHSLGLDTHDVGLTRDDVLVPGNIITVEPGIYIKEEEIGIRIEDNILVTEEGNINLSEFIIKSIDEIEEYMANVEEA